MSVQEFFLLVAAIAAIINLIVVVLIGLVVYRVLQSVQRVVEDVEAFSGEALMVKNMVRAKLWGSVAKMLLKLPKRR